MRPSGVEEVFSEAAASPTEGPVEEHDLEEGCNDENIQVKVENLPPELDLDQRSTAQKFIRGCAGLFQVVEGFAPMRPTCTTSLIQERSSGIKHVQ